MSAGSAQRTAVGTWQRPGFFRRAYERGVKTELSGLREGRLRLREGSETTAYGAATDSFPLTATVEIHDPGFYADVALGGAIGAAEAYMDGKWRADDLCSVIRILTRNREVGDQLEGGAISWRRLLLRLLHALRRNTASGSRKNIAAHYDLGNEFFRAFLDPTMMYSSAIFPSKDSTLEEAQRNKLETICTKLRLEPSSRVIEIGTGWGGFALHAASRVRCHVTTTTISRKQYEYATQRVKAEGLQDRVTVLDKDYRELPFGYHGAFDHLVSIEMIEAVGARYLDTYFAVCRDLLKSTGSMLLQAIVIADQLQQEYERNVDFIQKYIFPGGSLPSVTSICSSLARASDLRVFDLEDITEHYALTLRGWRRRFDANRSQIEAMGFDDRFQRMWEYYFCYCEGGFLERNVGVVQMHLTRPGYRGSGLQRQGGGACNG